MSNANSNTIHATSKEERSSTVTPLENVIASATKLIDAVVDGRVWIDITRSAYSSNVQSYRIKVDSPPEPDF